MFHVKFINKKSVIYSDLIPEVEHFFTTRETVIRSQEESMQEAIKENLEDICSYLSIDKMKFISPNQTHSDNVRIANNALDSYPNTDALILDNYDQAVYLNFADCTPLILYDKKHNVGAIAHAGWRGTAAQIGPKTFKLMQEKYLSQPEDLLVVIGPTIAICCYSVGEDVFNKLNSTINDITPYYTTVYDKIYVDLKGINKQQFIDLGVKRNNIDVCPYCTSCNNDMFFSYRKEQGTTSRHSAILKLKKKTIE